MSQVRGGYSDRTAAVKDVPMSKTCSLGPALLLAVLFFCSGALGQGTEKKMPTADRTDCEPDNCISKVLYFPDSAAPTELQDAVNILRVIAEIRYVYLNQSQHTISLKGTAEQIAITEKLVNVLENLRASGGHDRTSVLVYQMKGPLSGTTESKRFLVRNPRATSTMCDLTTCYVQAVYLPDLSPAQLQDTVNRVRSTAHITRIILSPSDHVIVLRGTSEQVDLAEKLTNPGSFESNER